MKIVVNKCFGGFDLSDRAQERLIELGVKYFESYDELAEAREHGFDDTYIIKDEDSFFGKYNDNFDDIGNRTNKLLIQVVEELKDEANGCFGQLEIVDVPDDVNWKIDDYDGIETIHEVHRSW